VFCATATAQVLSMQSGVNSNSFAAMTMAGCQANHANVFHNLGGLDMLGLKKANLNTPKSCVKAISSRSAVTGRKVIMGN